MSNLERLLSFLNHYENKEIVDKLSYLNLEHNNKGKVTINTYNRERCLSILKSHESVAKKSGLERYGLQDTIDKLSSIDDIKVILLLYRDELFHAEFYFHISCENLISIVLIKSRNKTKNEIKQELERANKTK